jgi:hypothetical protein
MTGKKRWLGLFIALALVSSALLATPVLPPPHGCQGTEICKICGCGERCPVCPLCCAEL